MALGGHRVAASCPKRANTMKRVLQAPNLALATLWADQLAAAGIPACVQRAYASGIVGHIPPDQALPEVWAVDDAQAEPARQLLDAWRRLPERRWACRQCGEWVEGPFDRCWNCGAGAPD
jgi:hypothetical protein